MRNSSFVSLISNRVLQYTAAVLVAFLALVATKALPILHVGDTPLLVLLSAVVVSTWLFGWKAGLLTTALCATGYTLGFILSPSEYLGESVRLTVFLVLALLILSLALMRQDAEESLIRSETQLRSILENSLDPIGVSVNGIHRYVNPAYVRMFGYEHSNQLVGRSVLNIIAQDEREPIQRRIERRSRGLPVESSYETRGLKADGSQIEMEVHVSSYSLQGETYSLVILRDIADRKRSLREKEALIGELRGALAKVKTLSGLLPTCAGCRKIRDEKGEWQEMENYICEHSDAGFSHGLCPECAERLYPEVFGTKVVNPHAWSS